MAIHESAGKSDEWYTPKYVFDAMGAEFDLDVASPMDRSLSCVPANNFICDNSLNVEWNGFVWCNPPFGGRNGLLPWIEKMIKHNNGILLTPDRTSAPWWQYCADSSYCHLQVNGKIKFIRGHGNELKDTHPGNGTTLFAFGYEAARHLILADKNKLGICFKRI